MIIAWWSNDLPNNLRVHITIYMIASSIGCRSIIVIFHIVVLACNVSTSGCFNTAHILISWRWYDRFEGRTHTSWQRSNRRGLIRFGFVWRLERCMVVVRTAKRLGRWCECLRHVWRSIISISTWWSIVARVSSLGIWVSWISSMVLCCRQAVWLVSTTLSTSLLILLILRWWYVMTLWFVTIRRLL